MLRRPGNAIHPVPGFLGKAADTNPGRVVHGVVSDALRS